MGLLSGGAGIGAGLAEAGKNVADTAGKWTLEAQRADAETEKVKLIDQLTGVREEKGRAFQTSERVATQGYQSGEKALDRTNAMDMVKLQTEATVKAAGISAGPGYASVAQRRAEFEAEAPTRAAKVEEMKADTGLKQKTLAGYDTEHQSIMDFRKAQTESYKAENILKTIQSDSQKNVLDAKKQLDDALVSNDPAKIADAKNKIFAAEFSAKDETQRVVLYQSQARLIEQAMAATQSKLVALQDPSKSMTPAAQSLIETLTKDLDRQRMEYNTATKAAAEALKNLPTSSTGGSDTTIRYDAHGNRIGAAPANPAPAPPVTGRPAPLLQGAPSITTPGPLLSPGP